MQTAGMEPDIRAYNSLVTACADGDKTDEAVEEFESMRDIEGNQPDVNAYNSLIAACEFIMPDCIPGHRIDHALGVFADMLNAGMMPQADALAALTVECARTDKLSKRLRRS